MLSKKIILPIALLLLSNFSKAQTAQNLGMPINSQLTSEYNPSLSGNGRTMIFISTTGEDGQPELVMTTSKSGVWSRPETVPNLTSKTGKVQLAKDYVLSYDGNTILFSASRFGGVGGIDIWMMEKKGTTWQQPTNPGKPINSDGTDTDPSLSSDSKYLYFVRADKKTVSGLPCGKIFYAEKSGNLWKEPKELPATINTGCACSPRILADNQTLLFSAEKAGGKGGLDVYRTQMKEDGTWSSPVPVSIINTNKDDQYVSVPADGNFIYYTGAAKTGTDLFKMKLPDELKPKKILLLEGYIKDATAQKGLPGKVVVYTANKKNTIYSLLNTDPEGRYYSYLVEGNEYEFSGTANDKNYLFYSALYDLKTMDKFEERPFDIKLSPLKPGTSIVLPNLSFDGNSAKLLDRSNNELFRIQKLMQDNPTLKIEIAVYTDLVVKDTTARPELFEQHVETMEIPDPSDSTGTGTIKVNKTVYSNDATQQRADAIVEALSKKGVAKDRIFPKGYGDTKPIADNSNEHNRSLNRRIELIIK
jgi:outer membrane protein OmpA-like peptidoglycan-associated protein